MVSVFSKVYRGKLVESKHEAIFLIKDVKHKNILSSDHDNQPIYPRSAIKIFQALPFINSNAHIKFNLTKKHIAISCSSHTGELKHINVLKDWIKKINILPSQLQCGIHNPLNEESSKKLFLSGSLPIQLHNNCSGKHLGMISGSLAKKIDIKNYTSFNHPHQKLIRNSLEYFMGTKIKKKYIGIDGCNAPQYAFPMKNIATAMINLINDCERKNEYTNAINLILSSINQFPILVGGSNQFDSDIIKVTKGRLFTKGGAEGVLIFADFSKKIGGVIKVLDGNNRAIAPTAMKLFLKLKLLYKKEKIDLHKWTEKKIYNHKKQKVGKIITELE